MSGRFGSGRRHLFNSLQVQRGGNISGTNPDRPWAVLAAMHYIAVATDYDGTIAEHGVVDEDTIKALEKLHPAARRLILVTGESWPGWSR
jgi:hypothetical protein